MIALVGIMLAAQVASGSAPTPATVATPTPVAGKSPLRTKLICVDAQQLGTRLGGHRICRTKEDWTEDQHDARMITENAQRTNFHQ